MGAGRRANEMRFCRARPVGAGNGVSEEILGLMRMDLTVSEGGQKWQHLLAFHLDQRGVETVRSLELADEKSWTSRKNGNR